MKYKQYPFLITAVLVLTMAFLTGCGPFIQKIAGGGIELESLKEKNPEVVSTFRTANENGKKVLVIFDAAWCGYCRKFNQITMKDREVRKTLTDFEVVNIDVDRSPEAMKVFQKASGGQKIGGVPTLMIFNSNGTHKARVTAYYKPPKFNDFLKKNS
ncbi:MAG: thioredoxin fold domain-containing protein [Pyrinomonadaceae bacterium]